MHGVTCPNVSGKGTTLHPLEQAARLIGAYAQTLSGESSVCPHCSRESFTDWPAHLEAAELRRMIAKLRKLSQAGLPRIEPASAARSAARPRRPL